MHSNLFFTVMFSAISVYGKMDLFNMAVTLDGEEFQVQVDKKNTIYITASKSATDSEGFCGNNNGNPDGE